MATGGFKLSLAGAKGKPGFKKSTEQPTKRRRLALDDDEPEDTTAKQEITGWDAAEGGAVDANKKEEPKGPRVIPSLPNRNWREVAQKRQLARTGAAPPTETSNGNNAAQLEQPQMAVGLNTFDRTSNPEPMDVDGDNVKPEDNRTEEEKLQAEAFEALVNGKAKDQSMIPITEEEAFENDMREAPEAPDLAAYEATPIEGFGAALLRGMGWKDDDSSSKDKKPGAKPKEMKRRPALLGIGAKPEAAVGVELGEWAGPKKGGKKAIQYNPVALKNKRTGEIITEEELKERLAKQKEEDAKAARNSAFVGDGDDNVDERRREKRRERKERDRRDDDYDSERKKDKSRRRDRDDDYSDRDRDRRREKKHSEYEDSDRDRRRDKKYLEDDYEYDDRKREKRRDKERDRSRSPYDDDRRQGRRERDRRERSIDSKDRREKRRERSRSRDSEDRRKKRRDYEYRDDREDRRSKYKDDKYPRR